MKDHSFSKCSTCGEVMPAHKLTACDHCLRKFCDEHIYVGVDTGDYFLKNFCSECIDLLGINVNRREEAHRGGLASAANNKETFLNTEKENKQINVSLLKKTEFNDRYSKNGFTNNTNGNSNYVKNTSYQQNLNGFYNPALKLKRDKWEYKSVFLAIDSDVEIDEQILEHIVHDYLNVFPINKDEPSEKERKAEVIDIRALNELGDKGWEVITTIPKTKSIILLRKNGKPSTQVSANVSGAYVILKRKKLD